MSFIGRLGTADIDVPAAQSIIVGSFGPGSTKVLYGTLTAGGLYNYTLQALVSGGATTFGSFASGQRVRVEASPACEVEYVTGAAPQLTAANVADMPTITMGTSQTIKRSAKNALTAHAGGGQGSALALTEDVNRVTTVASAGDSVKLPAAKAGRQVVVINAAAANSMDVFPSSGEVINALAADAQLAVAANKAVIFTCAVDGTWNSVLTA